MKPTGRSARLGTVHVTPAMLRKLQTIAADEGRTFGEVVREALAAYLRKHR